MTVKDLIEVLGTFPADMPVGSIHTCECCTSVEPVEPRHVRLGTIEHSGAMSPPLGSPEVGVIIDAQIDGRET